MLNQSQLQRQTLKILPQQVQMLGIYHLNMMDLEQRIKDELDENPLLENLATEEVELQKTDPTDPPQEFQNWDEYGYDDIPNYTFENQSYIHNNSLNLPIKDSLDLRTSLKQQLINLDLDAAKFSIKGAGLTIGTITYEGSITDSTNVVVVSQSPMKSDSLSKTSIGTRINLTVSQGQKTNEPN